MKILNYQICTDYSCFLMQERRIIINTLNPHSYCVAQEDRDFKKALQESTYLLPDGIGIVWAARVLKGNKIKKIAGYDIFLHLMQELSKTGGSCFFLGASENTLQLIKDRAAKEFPDVQVSQYSPPYKAQFSAEDNAVILQKIHNANPDVLFVGMTAPKQEKWVHENKDQLQAKVICSIGAVFDFYAGTVKRPSAFWIKMGLEWLPRFLKEPRRLAERNVVSTPKFVWEVFKEFKSRKN